MASISNPTWTAAASRPVPRSTRAYICPNLATELGAVRLADALDAEDGGRRRVEPDGAGVP